MPCDIVEVSGINPSFLGLFPSLGQVSHVLRTRSPLSHVTRRSRAFDLHVLSTPPAFVLSQDQTLRQDLVAMTRSRCDTIEEPLLRFNEVENTPNATAGWNCCDALIWQASCEHRC